MATKTTGVEYKAYIAETDPKWWPEGSYMDDDVVLIDGAAMDCSAFDLAALPDSAAVVIECGTYYSNGIDSDPIALETHFKRWRKAQTTVRFAVEVHRDKLEALKLAIKAAGGVVS